MCGIAAIISNEPVSSVSLTSMLSQIRHRGPDDEGVVFFADTTAKAKVLGGDDTPDDVYQASLPFRPEAHWKEYLNAKYRVGLGHRRLSILDLSPLGHQPMSIMDGKYWIVYNGEIFNYIEIREELNKIGYEFKSRSDTEVILAAYAEWGEEAVNKFNGMFSFLIFDRDEETIFLARDRFGVKPLYYWPTDHGIAFASEIKQFTVLPEWSAQLNHQRAYDFLVYGLSDHTDETLFDGVFQVKPGHCARIKLSADIFKQFKPGKISTRQWYKLEAKKFVGSYELACQQFLSIFEDAVRLRLRADVDVGSCLSGGLDSSSIVCVMNKILRDHGAHSLQNTFSACADEKKYDERKWIDIVVEHTGVKAHYTYPKMENVLSALEEVTWYQDEPFGSTSIYAQWSVFESAKQQKVKVMLDGQGSDEQLAGYHTFFGPHLANLFTSFRWLEMVREIRDMRRHHGYGYKRAAKYIAAHTLPESIKNNLKKYAGYEHTSPDWLNHRGLTAKAANPLDCTGAARAKTVQELSIAQLTASNVQMLLHWEDRDSMAHSIESRVPFLDYRLVEFVLGLPSEYKLSNGITKRVLRDAMENVLPEQIKNRMDKIGFATPEEIWMCKTAPEKFKRALCDSLDVCGSIFEKEKMLAKFDNMVNGNEAFSFLPWRVISFGMWLKKFSVEI